MLSPQFIIKFEYLDKIDFPESEIQLTEIKQDSKKNLLGTVSSSEDKSSAITQNSGCPDQKKTANTSFLN